MTTDELNIVITADTGNAAQNIGQTARSLENLGDSAKTADTDMSALVKAMSDAAANMVSVSQNIATSAAGLTGFQSGLDAVSSALQGVNVRFDVLNSSIQQSYLAFDGAATSVTNLAASSETSAAALNSIVSATDGFASRMDELQTNTQGTSDGMAALQRELQETLTSICGFSDNMSNAGKDAEEASQKIRDLSDEVQKLAQKSNSGSMGIAGIAAGFKSLKGIVATLGIGKFIKDSYDAYNVQMQNELKLTAHMKQRMNATDEEVQSIKDLASAQQQLGVIGDEIQLAGAQQLTTYARQSSTLKTLLPAMNNLIAQNAGYEASVGDATSAADMLGRALNGQYTSLKRMGVTFTEAQEQVLKYGTESQKASVLAEAINNKVGNMNELLAQTPTGKLKQLQNDFGDLQEQLGATFQPLISSVVPVIRGALEMLAPPIMNVSKGITVIGQAIASIDSPAVRGIALAAAGVAIVNKLRLALGGGGAALLVIGTILTGILGSMQEEQQSIGDIVSDAYNSAANAAGDATDAMSDYNDEIVNTQKSINRLAGFDTITKLSGGSSSGALVNALLGDNGLEQIYEATNSASELDDIINNISAPEISFEGIKQELTDVGEAFKMAFSLDPDEQIKGLRELDSKLETYLGELYTKVFRPVGKSLGQGFYHAVEAAKSLAEGDVDSAAKSAVISQSKFAALNPFLTADQKEAANRVEADIRNNSAQTSYDIDQSLLKPQEDILKSVNDIPKNVAGWLGDTLQWDTSWFNEFSEGWSNTFGGLGSAAYDFTIKDYKQGIADKNSYYDALSDIEYAIIDRLKEGLTADAAITAARGDISISDDMQKWFDQYITDNMSRVYQFQENLLSSGQIQSSSTDYRDVPTRSTSDYGYVRSGNINFSAYIDGEQVSAHVVSNTDKRSRFENAKYD